MSAPAHRLRSKIVVRVAIIGALIAVVVAAIALYRRSTKPDQRRQAVFTQVYDKAIWGKNASGQGYSGVGSTMQATVVYRAFLRSFMEENGIRSVVDAGCGDWEFSHAVDWTGIDYRGYDIVPSIAQNNNKKYAAPNIHFFVADIVKDDLPPADLLLCKHVLQHLSNQDIAEFLKQLPKYKFSLITNGVNSQTLTASNADISAGEYRPLDLTREPFGLRARKVLSYFDGTFAQLVLCVTNRD